jgi:hypothetical protein
MFDPREPFDQGRDRRPIVVPLLVQVLNVLDIETDAPEIAKSRRFVLYERDPPVVLSSCQCSQLFCVVPLEPGASKCIL